MTSPGGKDEGPGLRRYVAYAAFLHTLFVGLSAFKPAPPPPPEPAPVMTIFEVEPVLDEAPLKPPAEPDPPTPKADDPPPAPSVAKTSPRWEAKGSADPRLLPPEEPGTALGEPQTEPPEVPPLLSASELSPHGHEPAPSRTIPLPPRPGSKGSLSVKDASEQAGNRRTGGTGPGRGGRPQGLAELGRPDNELPTVEGGPWVGPKGRGALRGELCFITPGTRRLTDVTRCTPEAQLFTNSLRVTPRRFEQGFPGVSDRFEWFALNYRGKFDVSRAGVYKFRLHSDDGSLLWINGELVVNNDGTHSPTSKMGSIELEEGKHRIRVFYFQGPRTEVALELYVTPPGETERIFTPKL